MKKLLITTLLLISTTAMAQHHHGHWERRGGGWGWVAPVVIGGVIGYELAKPAPVVVQQPPVVVQPQVVTDPNLVIVNGVLYRKVMMQVNGTYQEVLVRP